MSKFFIDCEFVEGKQDKTFLGIKVGETKPTIDLISIGIVSEDLFMTEEEVKSIDKENHRFTPSSKRNKEYYAISKDFNLKAAWNDEWVRVNVLRPIFDYWYNLSVYGYYNDNGLTATNDMFTIQEFRVYRNLYGRTNQQIAKEITEFVNPLGINNIIKFKKEVTETTFNQTKIDLVEGNYVEFYGYYSASDWVAFYQLFGKMIDLPKWFPKYCNDLKMEADRIWRETGKDTKFDKPKDAHNALVGAHFNYNFHKFLNTL